MDTSKEHLVNATIITKEGSHEVELFCLPRQGEFLRFNASGETEPFCVEVDCVVHSIDANCRSHNVEIHAKKSMDQRATGKKYEVRIR
jgi:hypothetical protein